MYNVLDVFSSSSLDSGSLSELESSGGGAVTC